MTRRTMMMGTTGLIGCATPGGATAMLAATPPVRVTFVGAATGKWKVVSQKALSGAPLAPVAAIDHLEASSFAARPDAAWQLIGVRSNERYSTRAEHDQLAAVQAGLAREDSTRACLIPMSKSAAWWALAQDERRAIFEAQSRHVALGAKYLPAIARRLYHGREVGGGFDFLTWFEFAPASEAGFDALLLELRASPEWRYVSHEVELRLSR